MRRGESKSSENKIEIRGEELRIGAGTGVIFLLRWFWMRINAWSEIVAMAVSFACAFFFQIVWSQVSDVTLLFWQKLLLTIAVTTVAWLVATFLTPSEDAALIAKFRASVRAKGRDIGRGVLLTFVVSLGVFLLMYVIGRVIYAM